MYMVKGKISSSLLLIAVLFFCFPHLATALIEDFEDGDADGWLPSKAAEAGEKNWSVKDGAWHYKGGAGIVGASMRWTAVNPEWRDYTIEADIMLFTALEFPCGISGRMDPKTGGRYAAWVYPSQKAIKLISGTDWDINQGLRWLDEAPIDYKLEKWHTIKIDFKGNKIKVYWDNELKIEFEDKVFSKGLIAIDFYDVPVSWDNIRINGPGIPPDFSMNLQNELTATWGEIKSR